MVVTGAYAGWNAWQLREKRERWFEEQRRLLDSVFSKSGNINKGYDDFMNILLWFRPATLEPDWLSHLNETLSILQEHTADGNLQQTLVDARKNLNRIGHLRRDCIVWGNRFWVLREDLESEESLKKVRVALQDMRHDLEALQGEKTLEYAAMLHRTRGKSGRNTQISVERCRHEMEYYLPIFAELTEMNNHIEQLASEYSLDGLVNIKDNHLFSISSRLKKAVERAFEKQSKESLKFFSRLDSVLAALFGRGYKIDTEFQTIHIGEGGLYSLRNEFIHLTYQRDVLLLSVEDEFNRFKILNARIMVAFGEVFEKIILKDQSEMQRLWNHLAGAGFIFLSLFLILSRQILREAHHQVTELRMGRERLRSIMNSMMDGLITIDGNGRVESYNPAAGEIFQISGEKPVAGEVAVLIPDLDLPVKDSPGYSPRRRREATGRRPDGSRFPLELSLSPIPMAEQPLFSVIIRDITQQKLFEDELRRMAIRDPLTGLFNRGEGMRILKEEFERADRYHRSFSVIMLDIDHFKRVNDTFGHGVGDRVLCATATLLVELVRISDTVARYGGEEMLIILPEADMSAACQLAERLREGIATQQIAADQGDPIQVTASFGVATYPDQGKTVEVVLAAADQALYSAKAAGRNRVCGWPS